MNFVNPSPFTTRPEIDGTFGVVTSTHWLATAVGMGILERGGNAFDAACATAFTLQVVEPHLNGPGGDVPVILYDVRRGKPEVICGQGSVPAGATIAHYRDELGLDLVPGTGLLAACIPGTFDTWMTLLRDYGTMRLADVLVACDRLCAQRLSAGRADQRHDRYRKGTIPGALADFGRGVSAGRQGAEARHAVHQSDAGRHLRAHPEGGAGRRRRPRGRDRARAQGLERGLRRRGDRQVLPHARRSWTRPAAAIAACSPATTWRSGRRRSRRRSPMTTAATPCSRPVRGRRAWSPCSSSRCASASDFDGLDPRGPDFIHWQVECAKLAFADRDTFYGDPKFVTCADRDAALRRLQRRARQAGDRSGLARNPPRHDRRASARPWGCASPTGQRAAVGASGAGEPTVGAIPWTHDEDDLPDAVAMQARKREKMGAAPGDTVHFDIVDRDGNMVSSTPSGGWLHSSPVIPELGFCLGTRAQMFWLEEGHPASLAPGKRPRSTLTPDPGAARRRAVSRLGLARRRPAGPVDHAVLPAPRPCRHEPAGGDRRAGLAYRAFPLLVLAAHRAPGCAGGRRPRAEGRRRTN